MKLSELLLKEVLPGELRPAFWFFIVGLGGLALLVNIYDIPII